jgi:uracil-DNA glycosylase
MPTLWQAHCAWWKAGCGSKLCPEAQHVCLARGTVLCDILFVGEAPSIAADVVGEPFTGVIRAIMGGDSACLPPQLLIC